ncbi:mitochondrial coenzyme A diphosphatase NUDT8-like [Achroia grisella]|uniref:mitochondrial coenzyme A diphosphatase NUDT8-like n=1 Tax=Achroia grisella TaxID=688607 RepID=UPI0027D2706F|nr:mitochondrial coenzyme A diphosphatase NUDT8-like [Achroia grisella]
MDIFFRLYFLFCLNFIVLINIEIIMAKINYCIENIFSQASRQHCISKLKEIRVPKYNKRGKAPEASAAVLVPLCRYDCVPSLLYTVRSSNLNSHSGQISFPGGKTDADETPTQTALRETKEEIGLSPDKIDVWGVGQGFPGRDNKILISPVIGCIQDLKQEDLIVNHKEVAEVFTVPIDILCNPENQFHTQFRNGFILPVFIANQYKIWGLTAYVTHMFLSSALSRDVYKNDWMKKKIELANVGIEKL